MSFYSKLFDWQKPRYAGRGRRKGGRGHKVQYLKPCHLSLEPLESRQLLSVSPLNDECLVNSVTADTQRLAETGNAVAAWPDGHYLVTWTSAGQDGDGKGVYAQRFNADGSTLGSEFQVNTTTDRKQHNSSAAAAADGSSVIV